MSKFLGLHLGIRAATAISIDGNARIINTLQLPRETETENWLYSQQQFSLILKKLAEKFSKKEHIVALSLPVAGVYYRCLKVADLRSYGLETVRFAIEPTIPVPIEQLHVSLVKQTGQSVNVVAIALNPYKGLLEQLDRAGWICPVATGDVTSVWKFLCSNKAQGEKLELFCVADPVEGGIVASAGGRMLAVRPLYASSTGLGSFASDWLNRELAITAWACDTVTGSPELKVVTLNVEGAASLSFAENSSVEICCVRKLFNEAAFENWGMVYAYSAARALLYDKPSIENIRSDELKSSVITRRNLNILQIHSVGIAAVFLGLALGLLCYGYRIKSNTIDYRQTCKKIWVNLFPTSRIPVDIPMTLRSELAREKGLRRQHGGVPEHIPALDILRDVVSLLPSEIPIFLENVDISGEICVISGQARTHGEVEKIANRLVDIKGIIVLPPATEQMNTGVVRFNLRLERKGDTDGSASDTAVQYEVPQDHIENYSGRSLPDFFVDLMALAKSTNKVNDCVARTGTHMHISGRVNAETARSAKAGRRSGGGFACTGGLSGNCCAEGWDEPEPDKLHSSTISKAVWGHAICANINACQVDEDDTGRYGEAYLVPAASVAGADSDESTILGGVVG